MDLPHGKSVCQLAICRLALAHFVGPENMPAMTNRIREVRKSRQITLEEMAEATGISVSHLSRIEAGQRGLGLEGALRIAAALRCEVMDITDDFSPDDIEAGGRLDLSRATADAGDVANLNIHAGMGNGGLQVIEGSEAGIVPAEFTDGFWTFPESVRAGFQQLGRTYALPVIGDSMEPTLAGGSIVFVDTSHVMPSPPDLYAVDYGDGLMIKRIELLPRSDQVRVVSDNVRYREHEMHRDHLRVYGRVVAAFQWRG